MKKLIILLLTLPILMYGQEEKAPSLYEVINIKVKADQTDEFEAAVKAHNAKFHEDGLYNARLYFNVNGPLGGMYTWIMGATTWTAMDSRPAKGSHDDDWKSVDQHVESYGSPGYWTVDRSISHMVPDMVYKKRLIWMYDIKSGQAARWSELIGKIQKVYTEKRPDESYWVAWNELADTKKGHDVALIFGFNEWAWMDNPNDFAPLYEEVHGAGSWMNFMSEFRATINGRVDWLRTLVD